MLTIFLSCVCDRPLPSKLHHFFSAHLRLVRRSQRVGERTTDRRPLIPLSLHDMTLHSLSLVAEFSCSSPSFQVATQLFLFQLTTNM